MTDARDALMVGRSSDGRLVQRPLSPHLMDYKPQITSVLSILHRMTGVAISVGLLLMAWFLIAAASSDGAYAWVSWFIRSPIGILVLFGFSVANWYHFCNGIRHLAWDAGYGLDLVNVHATGRLVLIATAVLTVLTWIGVIIAW